MNTPPPFTPVIHDGANTTNLWFDETLYADVRQGFTVHKELFRARSEHQDVMVAENPVYGRVLTLDGAVQVAQNGEYVYHEMMTHVPLLAHGAATEVLIIGGGDGGIARECLKHKNLNVTMVEIDRTVVDMCAEHMPMISNGAFDNPRLQLVIDDGCRYVAETDKRFDVILVDSTDPIGPGAVLFTEEFYTDCKRCLTGGGILVTQNGVPFFQPQELQSSVSKFRRLFAAGSCYLIAVPFYYGGFMALGWASDNTGAATTPLETLKQRFAQAGLDGLHYYSPEMHRSAFALPPFIARVME